MSKPSWKDAPQWANWLAQDADGEWYWYTSEPKVVMREGDTGCFEPRDYRANKTKIAGQSHYNENWKDTLEQRPTKLTPRSLGCFDQVADVIGEVAAERELQRVVDDGIVPEQLKAKYWDGDTWPIPAGQVCIIQSSSTGTPCKAVVDYMDATRCVWHWEGDDSTIHNNVKYMTFRPVKSERDEMIERIEAYFPQKAGMLSYEEVAEFVLDVIGDGE